MKNLNDESKWRKCRNLSWKSCFARGSGGERSSGFSRPFLNVPTLSSTAPSLLLLNARSVVNKLDELNVLISVIKPSLLILTETWLHDGIMDGQLNINGYCVFPADRQQRCGGGVWIWAHYSLRHKAVTSCIDFPMAVETMSIRISQPKWNSFICVFYIPPNLPSALHRLLEDSIIAHSDYFTAEDPHNNLIICGDFHDFDCSFLLSQLLYTNLVVQPTRATSILDQIWISEGLEMSYSNEAKIGPPIGSSDHNCVLLEPRNNGNDSPSFPLIRDVYDYRRSHIAEFLNCFFNYRTSLEFSLQVHLTTNVQLFLNTCYVIFSQALSKITKKSVALTQEDQTVDDPGSEGHDWR